MSLLRTVAAALVALPFFNVALAQTIALAEEDATVWAQDQVAAGTISGATEGTLYVNGEPVPFTAAGGTFAVPLRLTDEETTVVACAGTGGAEVCGDTLVWTLGYEPRPEAEVRASVAGQVVTFEGHVLDNPDGAALSFAWALDPDNPSALTLSIVDDSTATVTVPEDAPAGEYYVDWTVSASDGDARRARTFVTVRADGAIEPFVIEEDHAAWVERATVYEIAPRYFANQYLGRFEHITQKLPEIAELGVNTVWLQPIYPNANGGQAYDVTDYFGIWSELGTEEDLHELVETAHGLGLRVMFDFVPNHTSISHPYAQDAAAHGDRSHYYDFYQREFDDAPYSENYNYLEEGEMTFVYYFWEDLVNLDYHNPEVRRHMIEASRYWVETFDIDGYRFDAVWGVQARNPEFVPEWRKALKRVKPELFMLAESKATDEDLFEQRFDAAYDWTSDMGYISEWAWQRNSQETTLFNSGLEQFRARDLRNALTDFGEGYHPDALVFRYLENNDTPRFRANHSEEQTRMAAALLFSLRGIPMMYYGQEVAVTTQFPSFPASIPIRNYDDEGFFPYYQHLLWMRGAFPALTSDTFAEVPLSPANVASRTFAYRRWTEDENVVGAINMSDEALEAVLALPTDAMGLDPETTYYLTDLFSGEAVVSGTGAELASVTVAMPAFTTRLFAVADSVVVVPVAGEAEGPAQPAAFSLAAAYPNPFTARTTLAYEVGQAGPVRLAVYDVLGREVAVLVDGPVPAGRHTATFDAAGLASGVYLARLTGPGGAATQRMVLVR